MRRARFQKLRKQSENGFFPAKNFVLSFSNPRFLPRIYAAFYHNGQIKIALYGYYFSSHFFGLDNFNFLQKNIISLAPVFLAIDFIFLCDAILDNLFKQSAFKFDKTFGRNLFVEFSRADI